jgi:hypothetical protein
MSLKLLDYGRPNPFGATIGRPNRLAWPVNAYRVTLPEASNDSDGLNPFEQVILKLLDAVGAMGASALADETRIPLDLVKGILLRLRDKGLIDEHNAIIRRKGDNLERQEEKVSVFVTALLFRELATGRILPFLHLLNDGNPLRKRDEEKFVQMVSANQAHKQCVPVWRDVISALLAMKRRSVAFGRNDRMPAVKQITIARSPESYYLECPIAIQKSDGEFRIADPFGNGFSLVLERAFVELLEQDLQLSKWLLDWKQSLSNPRPPKSGPNQWPKESFDNEANEQSYPKLVTNLRRRYVRADDNVNWTAMARPIAAIYDSIEWALFYACCRRPFEDAITKLKFTAQSEHSALLGNAAQSVGLEPPELGFKPVPVGKFLDFQNGQAELRTVLAIAILQAENDESHSLRRIASLHRDLIKRLLGIKKNRDEKGHGKGGADSPDTELPADPFMREIVHALLPDISFADTPVEGMGKDAHADSLLDAGASIQSEFGFKTFNRLGANLQDRLIQAERFWLTSKEGEDAIVFACDLYAALQASFRHRLSSKLPPDIMDSEFITEAQKKAQENRLGELPECLSTVKPSAIRHTLQGNDQTLGACVVAFLLMSDDDTLRPIADSQPTFIVDLANVIDTRGHGNEPLPLPKEDIKKLRKAAFSTIKTLQES